MERPSRKSKVVDYCESKGFDDDEDFAPPNKKSREEVRAERRTSAAKRSSQHSGSDASHSQKSRKPLEDLDAAITLSLLAEADAPNPPAGGDEKAAPSSWLLSNCSVDSVVLGLDEITAEKKSQKTTEKPRKKEDADEDHDYKPKLTPESESDEDFSGQSESEDEESGVKKLKKQQVTPIDRKRKTPAAKKPKRPPRAPAVEPAPRSPPTAKGGPPSPASSPNVASSTPSPAGGRVPKWNPPALIGKSPPLSLRPADRSPGQGLRLGLSRRVRVKPLHPSVPSQGGVNQLSV